MALHRALPALLAGTAPRIPQDPRQGALLRRPQARRRRHRLVAERTARSTIWCAPSRRPTPGAHAASTAIRRGSCARACSTPRRRPIIDAGVRRRRRAHHRCAAAAAESCTCSNWRSTARIVGPARIRAMAGERMRRQFPVESARKNRRPRRIRQPRPCQEILILGVNGFIGHHLSQRIIATTDWEVYGMDMQTERIADLLPEQALPFLRRRHHDQQGVDRVPRQEMRRGAAAGGDRHAGHLREASRCGCSSSTSRPTCRSSAPACSYRKHMVFPSTSEVYGMCADARVRPGEFRPGAGPDQQAALDLRLRQAADGPRDPRLRHAGRARLHAVPAVQLDRRRAWIRSTPPRKAARA